MRISENIAAIVGIVAISVAALLSLLVPAHRETDDMPFARFRFWCWLSRAQIHMRHAYGYSFHSVVAFTHAPAVGAYFQKAHRHGLDPVYAAEELLVYAGY